MAIKLEDYEEFLQDAAPEVRSVLESTFLEASRVMSPVGLQTYMEGAKGLCHLGRGSVAHSCVSWFTQHARIRVR